MEPITFIVDKLKDFGTASHNFFDGLVRRRQQSSRRRPIEILKRLQRETFSDLMRLRDRQEKVEKVLSFNNTQRSSPLQENGTHVRGEVDILGALLLMSVIDNHSLETLRRAGISTGIHSRLTFETTVRENDSLVAEFVANQKAKVDFGVDSGSELTLSKVLYKASVRDWMSAIVAPIGARCRDVAIIASPSRREKGLTDISSFGPPLLDQPNGGAIGLTVRRSNVTASLAQFISTEEIQPSFGRIQHCFSTFGQLVCQFSRGTKLSLLGLLQAPKLCNQHIDLGALTISVGLGSRHESSETAATPDSCLLTASRKAISRGSMALLLESELDEVIRLGGWVEVRQSNPNDVQWAVSMSDNNSEEALGWGMNLGGIHGGTSGTDHFQIESYIKLNMSKRFNVKPGIAYVTDGDAYMMALLVRSNWSI
ncbi:hypothetical protein SDJN02_17120 [Cucurbita argyrosperma subsp. argyrosperma]|nr:hypothetical protein SDJN02_17120 [Cucurbita argyrosperma subsp. argyrosperma]